jgi:diadenosine tetraphosphate (Ap4A) HIT family hydrolase
MSNYQIWERFNVQQNLVKEFDYWLVSLRPSQITLGSCLFLLKRPIPTIAELKPEEAAELPIITRWFEERAVKVFGAEKFNYVAAMMKDPYVHYHAIPRYSADREFQSATWRDASWPNVIEFRKQETSNEMLVAIRDALKDIEASS